MFLLLLKKLLLVVSSSRLVSPRLRFALLKLLQLDVAHFIHIGPNCYFGSVDLSSLTIGKNSFINVGCYFDTSANVTIGNEVSLAPRVSFYTSTHHKGSAVNRSGETVRKPIVIEDGCWICANVVLLAGVTVGKGTIVAAGSVVNKDCLPNSLYAGVPARKIATLEADAAAGTLPTIDAFPVSIHA